MTNIVEFVTFDIDITFDVSVKLVNSNNIECRNVSDVF